MTVKNIHNSKNVDLDLFIYNGLIYKAKKVQKNCLIYY